MTTPTGKGKHSIAYSYCMSVNWQTQIGKHRLENMVWYRSYLALLWFRPV